MLQCGRCCGVVDYAEYLSSAATPFCTNLAWLRTDLATGTVRIWQWLHKIWSWLCTDLAAATQNLVELCGCFMRWWQWRFSPRHWQRRMTSVSGAAAVVATKVLRFNRWSALLCLLCGGLEDKSLMSTIIKLLIIYI